MENGEVLAVLKDIRNWTRAASHASVKAVLEAALPDSKARSAYQMLDGSTTMEQVRVACKVSPNALVALAQRCTSMGLMELTDDKRRVRLFNLNDFGLLGNVSEPNNRNMR
jgi:peptidyl-tRNA hydrolase